jgi:hypothetical protein
MGNPPITASQSSFFQNDSELDAEEEAAGVGESGMVKSKRDEKAFFTEGWHGITSEPCALRAALHYQ